jgi:outer membrane lipoprotein LolB
MRRAASHAIVAILGTAVAACATVAPPSDWQAPIAADAPFGVDGRLSARQGTQAITAHFAWDHAEARDRFVVSTPFGQTLAELDGDASVPRVEVRLSDGRRDEARDWSELTARALGFALPVAWLAAWVRGAPHADAAHTAEVDAAGRASVLRQGGWEIVYAYADDAARRPSRLGVSYPDVAIAIVIDRWRP